MYRCYKEIKAILPSVNHFHYYRRSTLFMVSTVTDPRFQRSPNRLTSWGCFIQPVIASKNYQHIRYIDEPRTFTTIRLSFLMIFFFNFNKYYNKTINISKDQCTMRFYNCVCALRKALTQIIYNTTMSEKENLHAGLVIHRTYAEGWSTQLALRFNF